ncbi:MAG: hypothetical protein H6559_08435 [Lewinellaceae bacterium]|nr:hypothetical protein [Lewinellaceae bacterium]
MPDYSQEVIFKLTAINLLELSFSLAPEKQHPLVAYNHHINVENGFNIDPASLVAQVEE